MQGDNDDGSFSQAELDRLVAEGILEVAEPGTPEHVAARRAMREEIEVADAEALGIHGPDALTSDRLLRQAALVAELDPDRVGYVFAAWCRSHGWERSDLASWLGVTVDRLAAMALEPLLRAWSHDVPNGQWPTSTADLAERYGADVERLAQVLAG